MSGQLTSLLVQLEIYKPINLINNCQCKNASILWPFNLSLIMLDLPASSAWCLGVSQIRVHAIIYKECLIRVYSELSYR